MAKGKGLVRGDRSALASVASGCRRFLPVITAFNPWLATILALANAGIDAKGDMDVQQMKHELDAIRRLVDRVERRVIERCGWTQERAQEVFRRPDTLKLMAEARDVYAIAQYESRLDRFADVLAGRAARPDADLQPDLQFARAALSVPDEGIEFVCLSAEKARRIAHEQSGVDSSPISIVDGQLRMSDFLRRREYADQVAVDLAVAAVHAAQAHDLIMQGEDRPPTMVAVPPAIESIRCTGGATAFFPNRTWWPTSLGLELALRVRARV